MSQDDKLDKDGLHNDGVPHYVADAYRLQSYVDAAETLSRFNAPVLVRSSNPHQHVYLAALDGTGSDLHKDPQHATNVAKIYEQVNDAGNDQIGAGYVPGTGTQDQFLTRALDSINGNTYDERDEQMYKLFIEQAWKWRTEDPQAEISLVAMGFSRGSDQAAGLTRMVHERGIQDPMGAAYTRDRQGQIKHVEYSLPALVAPGQVPQAVALFDAVGTGEPMRDHDRRLPPSVISGFQIIATDERRVLFKSDRVIDPGMTPDGRFLGVEVAGAHSDIGGGYHRDGLAVRSGNLMIDYVNSFSDRAFLERQSVPDDPRLNVVHRSEDGMLIYRLGRKVDRLSSDGYNELLVPRRDAGRLSDPYNAEPRDEALNRQFERQAVRVGAQTATPEAMRETSVNALSTRLDRLLAAGQANDWATFSRENQTLGYGDAGRNMLERAAEQANWVEQQAVHQQALPPPALPQAMPASFMQH